MLHVASRRGYPALRGVVGSAAPRLISTTSRRPLWRDGLSTRASLIPKKRVFSTTSTWRLHTKEMDEDTLASLKVDKDRLMKDLHHTCQWGTGERWGEYVEPKPQTLMNILTWP